MRRFIIERNQSRFTTEAATHTILFSLFAAASIVSDRNIHWYQNAFLLVSDETMTLRV